MKVYTQKEKWLASKLSELHIYNVERLIALADQIEVGRDDLIRNFAIRFATTVGQESYEPYNVDKGGDTFCVELSSLEVDEDE